MMKLEDIKRVERISAEDFLEHYVKTGTPIIITSLIKDWPAYTKWNFEYLKKHVGDVSVPIFDSKPAKGNEKSSAPIAIMTMREYIDILLSGPSDLRIFLLNVLKKFPSLVNDFSYPDIGLKFFKSLPTLFFGGQGAKVTMHYDLDWSNNLHVNFQGKKSVILFNNEQKNYLYKVPFAITAIEDIDFENPDFEEYPALKNATGWKTEMHHGDTLFIPSGHWHYIKYLTPSFSLTLRSLPKSTKKRLAFLKSLILHRPFDNLMRKMRGQQWVDYKNEVARKRANSTITNE